MTKKAWLMAGVLSGAALILVPAESRAETRFDIGVIFGHSSHRACSPYGPQDAYRMGYARGYQQGLDHGRDDSEDHDSFNFWHSHGYRDADSGYKGYYGPKCDYQRGFRAGYEVGYRRAYASYRGRYDTRYGYGRGDWDRDSRYRGGDDGRYDDRDERDFLYDQRDRH